jgi:hypothetical protein
MEIGEKIHRSSFCIRVPYKLTVIQRFRMECLEAVLRKHVYSEAVSQSLPIYYLRVPFATQLYTYVTPELQMATRINARSVQNFCTP